MKIGIYSPYLDTLSGGEKYIFTMASCLSREHEVTLFWDEQDILEKASQKFGLDVSKVQLKPNIFQKKGLVGKFIDTIPFDRFIYLSDGSIPIVGSKKLIIHFSISFYWDPLPFLLFLSE